MCFHRAWRRHPCRRAPSLPQNNLSCVPPCRSAPRGQVPIPAPPLFWPPLPACRSPPGWAPRPRSPTLLPSRGDAATPTPSPPAAALSYQRAAVHDDWRGGASPGASRAGTLLPVSVPTNGWARDGRRPSNGQRRCRRRRWWLGQHPPRPLHGHLAFRWGRVAGDDGTERLPSLRPPGPLDVATDVATGCPWQSQCLSMPAPQRPVEGGAVAETASAAAAASRADRSHPPLTVSGPVPAHAHFSPGTTTSVCCLPPFHRQQGSGAGRGKSRRWHPSSAHGVGVGGTGDGGMGRGATAAAWFRAGQPVKRQLEEVIVGDCCRHGKGVGGRVPAAQLH